MESPSPPARRERSVTEGTQRAYASSRDLSATLYMHYTYVQICSPFASLFGKRPYPRPSAIHAPRSLSPSNLPSNPMAPITSDSISKGRIAATTKAHLSLNIPAGSWSVVLSDGVQEVLNTAASGSAGRSSRGRSKVADLIFYASKDDAWEESAHLNGKRASAPASDTDARRSRSIAGVVKDVTINAMGGMGIGLVEGENNVAGTTLNGPAPTPAPAPASAVSQAAAAAAAIAAVGKLRPTLTGLRINNYPRTLFVGQPPVLTRAEIVGHNDSMCTIQFINQNDSLGGKTTIPLADAVRLFQPTDDPVGAFIGLGAGWPIACRVMRIMPAVWRSPDTADAYSMRAILLLLAAAGMVSAQQVDAIPSSSRDDRFNLIHRAMEAYERDLANVDLDAVDKKATEDAAGNCHFPDESYIARAVALAKAGRLGPRPPVSGGGASGGLSGTFTLINTRVPGGGLGTPTSTTGSTPPTALQPTPPAQQLHFPSPLGTQASTAPAAAATPAPAAIMVPGSAPAAPAVLAAPTALAAPPSVSAAAALAAAPAARAAATDDAAATLSDFAAGCGSKAVRFAMVAASTAEWLAFLRVSTLLTVSAATLRDELLRGEPADVQRKCAAALQSHLESLEGASESMLEALMPPVRSAADVAVSNATNGWFDRSVDVFNSPGTKMTSAGMMAQLRIISDRCAPAASRAPAQASMPLTVRVSTDADFRGLDEEARAEALSLTRDVSDIVGSTAMVAQLKKLGDLSTQGDLSALFKEFERSGAPLRRILCTASADDLARVMSAQQFPHDLSQIAVSARASLDRRMHVALAGSAATEPSSELRKGYQFLRQGRLGKARPGLFVSPPETSSTVEDPLGFLAKMPASVQDVAICSAFWLMSACLQIAHPTQGTSSQRFFLQLNSWIATQRLQGTSWRILSSWYAGVIKKADRRVDKLVAREVDSLAPLDTEWITNQMAPYNVKFLADRQPELAAAAASSQVEAAGGQKQLKRKELVASVAEWATQNPAQVTKLLKGVSINGKGKGAGKGPGGGKQPQPDKRQPQPAETPQPAGTALQLTDRTGFSGKSPADKSIYLGPDNKFKDGLQQVQEALTKEMGVWQGKQPCAFYHVNGKCKNNVAKCLFYH